jgi:hypothetical protein
LPESKDDSFLLTIFAGAKYYYLRAILHNWDDSKAVQIVWPAGLDLQMYTLFRTMERTASQWDAILDKAGLRAVAVKVYSPVMRNSVIFAAAK